MVRRVVSPNEHAFIYERQIFYASLTASECIDFCLKSNHLGVLCKFEIAKAYDHVSCSLLMVTL